MSKVTVTQIKEEEKVDRVDEDLMHKLQMSLDNLFK